MIRESDKQQIKEQKKRERDEAKRFGSRIQRPQKITPDWVDDKYSNE